MVYYKVRIFKKDALYMGGLFTLDAVNDQIDILGLTPDGNIDNDYKYTAKNINMFVQATPAKISERN